MFHYFIIGVNYVHIVFFSLYVEDGFSGNYQLKFLTDILEADSTVFCCSRLRFFFLF